MGFFLVFSIYKNSFQLEENSEISAEQDEMRNYECCKLDILKATNLMRPLVKLQLDAALLCCSTICMVDLKILFLRDWIQM